MIDNLMEQVNKTVDAAVEERAQLFGPYYASRLEGYGDVHRQMVGVSAAMKQLKKDIDDLVAYVNTQDVQEAMRRWIRWRSRPRCCPMRRCACAKR